jgi:hypothetical protein
MLGSSIASTSGRACACRNGLRGAAPVTPRRAAAAPRVLLRPRGALKDAPLVPVMEKGEMSQYPEAPGVYAVYDSAGEVQYIGLSRKVGLGHPAAALAAGGWGAAMGRGWRVPMGGKCSFCWRAQAAAARVGSTLRNGAQRLLACAARARRPLLARAHPPARCAHARPADAVRSRTRHPACALGALNRPPQLSLRLHALPAHPPTPARDPQVNASVANHMQALPELTHSVRFEVVADGSRDALTAAWKMWMEQASECRCGDGRDLLGGTVASCWA